MIKQTVISIMRAIAPRWTDQVEERYWLTKQAKLLRQQCRESLTLDEIVDAVMSSPWFCPCQRRTELLGLAQLIKELRPERVCEIGSASGGTLFLLCQVIAPNARVLSIDIAHTYPRVKAMSSFAQPGQHVTCWAADSHAPETLDRTIRFFAGRTLDFLMIDGDHSLAGVTSDYQMFAPLVRPGGLLAFHDIMPDFKTRFGIATAADVGQVPAFWADLKSQGHKTKEFIEDPDEDGMGIGILYWPGTVANLAQV